MPKTAFVLFLAAWLIGCPLTAISDMLNNNGFEQGFKYWGGTAVHDGNWSCGPQTALPPKDGKCYVWFEAPKGASIAQEIEGNFSGWRITGTGWLNGGDVRFVIWAFCNGEWQVIKEEKLTGGTTGWKKIQVDSTTLGNCTKVKWELYMDGNGKYRLDKARLYRAF